MHHFKVTALSACQLQLDFNFFTLSLPWLLLT